MDATPPTDDTAPLGRAEATQRRILDAAFAEFAAHGVAGARVDRIARAAGANKNLIYVYFGSKEKLFTATLEHRLRMAYDDHPLTPEDLGQYAGLVFDFAMDSPDVIRLAVFARLDPQAPEPTSQRESVAGKVESLRAAQAAGTLTDSYSPGFLLTFVMALATAWSPAFPYGTDGDRDALREQVVRAVRGLAPGS